jgi:imidazolonepropionase
MATTLIKNIGRLVTFSPGDNAMQIFPKVEIVIQDGKIAAIGTGLYSPEQMVADANGGLVTPGFVDAHTHPVFVGQRADEFEQRILGKTYQEIAASGGGIVRSRQQLQAASDKELKRQVRRHLRRFLRFGTTTIEAKSGYGLTVGDELRSLRILQAVAKQLPLTVLPTFLGAHAYPPEYRTNHQAYLDLIIHQMLPAIVENGLACFCDIFCEEGAFSVEESRQVLTAAKALGLGIRIHADEFKAIGALQLAQEYGAMSADHLTAITPEGIAALVEGRIVPVLLPGTSFFLGKGHYAPARELLNRGLPVAIASDFNPGSCMIQSMPLIMSIACLQMKMTPLEALQAATYNAALSLGIQDKVGALQPGYYADLLIWQFDDYRAIPYYCGIPAIAQVWKKGRLVARLPNTI